MLASYPTRLYEGQIIKDWYVSVKFLEQYLIKNIGSFKKYQLREDDTPEGLSRRFYETDRYWYLILMVNNIQDPFFSWFLSDEEIISHVTKYAADNGITDANTKNAIFQELAEANYNRVIYVPSKAVVESIDNELKIYLQQSS